MSEPLTDRDVAIGIRRLVLDHAFRHFEISSAPAAGPIGSVHPVTAKISAGPYFELHLDGRTFLVHVSERRSPGGPAVT